MPLTIRTVRKANEPTQLHQIIDKVKAHLQQAQEETTHATQDLVQAQEDLLAKCSNTD
jgi:hypothetical protein